VNPLLTTILFCLATAWSIAFLSEGRKVSEDSAVGIFFASSMAFGVLLIGLMKGYQADLFGYLFGNILAVSPADLWSSLAIGALVILLVWFFFKEFLLFTFDPEMARVTGLPVKALNLLMMSMIAVTIVISIKSVGIVLVSALIVTPAASAYLLSDDFKKMMLLSIILGVGSTWTGLLLSVWLNLASGATIVMVATVIFFICYFCSPQRRKLRRNIEELRVEVKEK